MIRVLWGRLLVTIKSAAGNHRSRGSVSVESVIVMPVFLLAMFAILQASLWVHACSVAQAAAADGVRAGSAYGGSVEEGRAEAESILNARVVGEQWVVSTEDDGRSLTIIVTGYATSVVPGMSVAVRESATLPWEGR